MDNLELRERVINAVNRELQLLNDDDLDDVARDVLKLPDRPEGATPFVGWLTTQPTVKSDDLRTSQAGINLIKRWEGFRSKAYICPGGVLTIGYGHTKTVKPGQVISEKEAEILLADDLRVYEKAVNHQVKVTLNQNQFDALVSFTFNCGTGALQQSTLLRKLNQGNYYGASNEFRKWVRAGNKVLTGLVSRREEERKLFLEG